MFRVLSIGLVYTLLVFAPLYAQEVTREYAKAWKAKSLNAAATALYGKEKFATIQKSDRVKLFVSKHLIENPQNIPVGVQSDIVAKRVAIFQDTDAKALVAVIKVPYKQEIDIEIPIRMETKGTIFAVVEGVDGRLYYTRAYADVLCLPCMAK